MTDGRPLVVFVLADCDPAGHQMAVSIGRKLQALRDLRFPDLEFEVVPVALTVDQVLALNLPSTPLKETEKRADKWRQAFGVEQTEIDALATLRPRELRAILADAIAPYFDTSLANRIAKARGEWREKAEEAIASQIDQVALAAIKERAETRIAELRNEIRNEISAMNDELDTLCAGVKLPRRPPIPDLILDETARAPLISSALSWSEGTEALIARKSYGRPIDDD